MYYAALKYEFWVCDNESFTKISLYRFTSSRISKFSIIHGSSTEVIWVDLNSCFISTANSANITIILLYYGNPQWSLLSKITQKWNETRTWRLRRTTLVHPRHESIGTAVIMYKLWRTVRLNPFHLQICIVTLYTVLRTFSKVPTGRICFKIKSYFC